MKESVARRRDMPLCIFLKRDISSSRRSSTSVIVRQSCILYGKRRNFKYRHLRLHARDRNIAILTFLSSTPISYRGLIDVSSALFTVRRFTTFPTPFLLEPANFDPRAISDSPSDSCFLSFVVLYNARQDFAAVLGDK